jgi:hypothetical protein
MTPCQHCPVGPSCVRITTGHRTYCDWAASGIEAKIAAVVRDSNKKAAEPVEAQAAGEVPHHVPCCGGVPLPK